MSDPDEQLPALPPRSVRPLDTPRWLAAAASVSWRVIVVAALLYGAFWMVDRLSAVVLPFALGLFVAALLEPLVALLQRVKVPRGVSAAGLLLVFIALLAGAASLFGWGMSQEVGSMASSLRDGWATATEAVGSWLPMVDAEEVRDRSLAAVQAAGEDASRVLRGAMTVGTVASQAGFTLVFAFFFLKDGPDLVRRTLDQVPDARRPLAQRLASHTWTTMGAYLRGTAGVAAFNTVLTGAAMWAIGVPMIGPVMVVTFVGSFVPYAGPAIAMVLATLLALANGGLVDAGLILAAALAIQALEGNVLQPYIVGEAVHLHPIAVLLAVTTGALVAGLAGAFLAVPVVASLSSAYAVITDAAPDGDEPEANAPAHPPSRRPDGSPVSQHFG